MGVVRSTPQRIGEALQIEGHLALAGVSMFSKRQYFRIDN